MLAIDVGNTHIKSAIFDGPIVRDISTLSTNLCQQRGSFLDLMPAIKATRPEAVVIASVRATITRIMLFEFAEQLGTQPLVVDCDTDMGIQNRYESSSTLGIDRLVNAASAYHLYRSQGRPLIVIDMGTATTIDFVDSQGAFIGGAIAPGLVSAYTGLRSLAPALPEIALERSARAVGRNTQECMASGTVIGHAAMIREMARLMAGDEDPVVVVTGGISTLLDDWYPKDYIIDRDLTLKGLRIIYERTAHAEPMSAGQ